ncbi:hypothetical protein Bca101_024551 [Brassica carinata]
MAVQRNQVGFIKGRLLCENILLAAELVSDFNKEGPVSRGCLQIDITKAYDNVDWRFILNILDAFELPAELKKWIRVCITSPFYSVALNGELTGFFPGKKGLRQGDPISSSLFVIAMDILSKLLDQAARNQQFFPHPKCHDPLVTHLSFADDMLIFFDGTQRSLNAILNVLRAFQSTSGLGLNISKSCLFLDGNNRGTLKAMADSFGLSLGSLPVKYLGLPLMPHRLRQTDYQPLIDKILARITSWKNRHLSFAGRLQLIQSVLNGIFNFWATSFPLPQGCIATLERICNAFLWSGTPISAKSAKVSWETVCTPKKSGGLGLRRLADSNEVFELRLIWLLFAGTGSLWVAWIKKNIISGRLLWTADFQVTGSWIWRRLMKLRDIARPYLSCQVRSGSTVLFWHDNWTGLGPLISLIGVNGPRITGIRNLSTVSQAIAGGAWSIPRGRNPIILMLKASLPPLPPEINPDLDDIFLWRNSFDSPPAVFSSSETWDSRNPPPPSVPWYSSVWFTGNIPKHSFIVWVTAWNRLPTRDKLRSWGLDVPPTCLLCGSSDETRDHLLFSCSYSLEFWNLAFSQSTFTPPNTFENVLSWVRIATSNQKLRSICKMVFQATVYLLWRERNTRLHKAVSRPVSVLLKEMNLLLRAKLYGLDQIASPIVPSNRPRAPSYLHLWFENFQP